jgi:hypothetical protein
LEAIYSHSTREFAATDSYLAEDLETKDSCSARYFETTDSFNYELLNEQFHY